MGILVPNLSELVGRLDESSDAHSLSAAFSADTIEAARSSVDRILEGWEGSVAETHAAGVEAP